MRVGVVVINIKYEIHLRHDSNIYSTVPEMISALTTLYERAFDNCALSIPLYVDLLLNWILKLYDGLE